MNGRTYSIGMLFVVLLGIALTLTLYEPLRSSLRWAIWSRSYKEQVAALPAPRDVFFKHSEWDGWGFGGSGTVMYLVFDPSNVLEAASRQRKSGKFSGLPCEVAQVNKMEDQWYTVLFYTDTEWQSCVGNR